DCDVDGVVRAGVSAGALRQRQSQSCGCGRSLRKEGTTIHDSLRIAIDTSNASDQSEYLTANSLRRRRYPGTAAAGSPDASYSRPMYPRKPCAANILNTRSQSKGARVLPSSSATSVFTWVLTAYGIDISI